MLNGQKLEPLEHYKYLGNVISSDGQSSKVEVRKRIAIGKEACNKRKILLTKIIDLELKKQIVKSVIWSVMLYGCQTWALGSLARFALEVVAQSITSCILHARS